MINRDPERHTALRLLDQGLKRGAFQFCSQRLRAAIELCATDSMVGLTVQKILGHGEDLYLVFFSERFRHKSELFGLVMRVVPTDAADNMLRAVRESSFLEELFCSSGSVIIPEFFAEFCADGLAVFVRELLPGKPCSEVSLGRREIGLVAKAIRQTQRMLSATKLGGQIISVAREPLYYKPKIQSYLHSYLGLLVDSVNLRFLTPLEDLRKQSVVIVSDRNPANFVIQDSSIGVFDFALTLVGVPYEDWSWFLDDPRLNSSLNRQELVQLFCQDYSAVSGVSETKCAEYFYAASVFVCIKQFCLSLVIGQITMAKHYLQCAFSSAQQLDKEVVILLESLQLAGNITADRLQSNPKTRP